MRKFILTLSALSILLLCFIVLNSFLTTKITIAAGPKGGFFDTSALLLKKRLKEKNIDLRIINQIYLNEFESSYENKKRN